MAEITDAQRAAMESFEDVSDRVLAMFDDTVARRGSLPWPDVARLVAAVREARAQRDAALARLRLATRFGPPTGPHVVPFDKYREWAVVVDRDQGITSIHPTLDAALDEWKRASGGKDGTNG